MNFVAGYIAGEVFFNLIALLIKCVYHTVVFLVRLMVDLICLVADIIMFFVRVAIAFAQPTPPSRYR